LGPEQGTGIVDIALDREPAEQFYLFEGKPRVLSLGKKLKPAAGFIFPETGNKENYQSKNKDRKNKCKQWFYLNSLNSVSGIQ
jgi:hypothetical protein